jgi:hypothetical protein
MNDYIKDEKVICTSTRLFYTGRTEVLRPIVDRMAPHASRRSSHFEFEQNCRRPENLLEMRPKHNALLGPGDRSLA